MTTFARMFDQKLSENKIIMNLIYKVWYWFFVFCFFFVFFFYIFLIWDVMVSMLTLSGFINNNLSLNDTRFSIKPIRIKKQGELIIWKKCICPVTYFKLFKYWVRGRTVIMRYISLWITGLKMCKNNYYLTNILNFDQMYIFEMNMH